MTAPHRSWPSHCRDDLIAAIGEAADGFPRPGQDDAQRVHDVRKTLKRASGLTRLFVPYVGASATELRRALKAARRRVARARDLDVLSGVLSQLGGADEAREILERVVAEQRALERSGWRDEGDAPAGLRVLGQAAENWKIDEGGLEPLVRAMRRTYRSARKLGERALESRESDEMHAMRGHVVDLGYQMEALEPAWPEVLGAVRQELQRLRGVLGEHHDLAVLADFARGRSELAPPALDQLLALIEVRRLPLERRADKLFARLFVERPGDFARRIASYLRHPRHRPAERTNRGAIRDSAP